MTSGEEYDDDGEKYNGKIRQFQREISNRPHLGRYKYKVVIIANIENIQENQLVRLTEGVKPEVFDFERCYNELLYPVLSGTLFKATGLSITLDLSNKSAGTKICYSVQIDGFECEITVVFVPTVEIAKLMSIYKNSILKYNPRSYLEFEGEKVNSEIKSSILDSVSNEFALLNNGITIVCDESGVNELSGRKHRAQLFMLNPQIINGGQTAYTLSVIYESLGKDHIERAFDGKEVLVKVIALGEKNVEDHAKKSKLIDKISTATNSQTVVTLADRQSGDPLHSQIQKVLYEKYGLLYERKKGEFGEGTRYGYINGGDILNRTLFARLYFASQGMLGLALRKRVKVDSFRIGAPDDHGSLEKFIVAREIFKILQRDRERLSKKANIAILPNVFVATMIAER